VDASDPDTIVLSVLAIISDLSFESSEPVSTVYRI